MDKTGGRPVLNNKELVHRALDITLTPMQDVVISEMKYRFGQSWSPSELMAAYGLDAAHIAEAAIKAISRK